MSPLVAVWDEAREAPAGGYYSGTDAAAIAGATYRKVDYWARLGLLVPAVEAHGSGSARGYTHDQLVQLVVLRILMDTLRAGDGRGPSVVQRIWPAMRDAIATGEPLWPCELAPGITVNVDELVTFARAEVARRLSDRFGEVAAPGDGAGSPHPDHAPTVCAARGMPGADQASQPDPKPAGRGIPPSRQ